MDLRHLDLLALREQIAVVSQDAMLLNLSAADNIRIGSWQAEAGAIRAAAEQAMICDEIDALPDGFATVLGEGGSLLSGGQRQRVSIARAILRDPGLVLLDEATSSLDGENESRLEECFDRWAVGRTVISVTHRLARAERADRIAVLEDGELVAVGRHAELLRDNPAYARLESAWLTVK